MELSQYGTSKYWLFGLMSMADPPLTVRRSESRFTAFMALCGGLVWTVGGFQLGAHSGSSESEIHATC